MRSQATAVSVLGALLVFGCSQSSPPNVACTEIGCQDGLTVDLQSTAWPAGSYGFDFSADGKRRHCTATLPLPPCDTQALACTGELETIVTVSGCALPADSQSFGPIIFRQAPTSVEITITRDGTKIGSATIHPTYRVAQPNGPRCEPTCRQASDRLLLRP